MIDASEIYNEVRRRMASRDLFSADDYYDLVDEVIGEFIDNGQMIQEDDDESLREELEMFWRQENSKNN